MVYYLLSLYQLVYAAIEYAGSVYAITTRRLIMITGWFSRRSVDVFFERIETIRVNQGIVGRLYNYGSILIIGTGGSRDVFMYVPQPFAFRRILQEQMNHE